jgi:vitamin B12 transporter
VHRITLRWLGVCLLTSHGIWAQTSTAPVDGSPAVAPPATEVVVRGSSAGERERRSADAVEVVELERARRSSADLGEVLARGSSLRVQRQGGLGSSSRYSMNGLSGDRVRFFLDGVPLDLTAFQLGVANVPVNLIERVEIYQGVVPIRFGADALGGAINLVTDDSVRTTRAGASYQYGSFGTHRLAGTARVFSERARAFARATAFLDRADNDYPIDAEVSDDSGQISKQRVRRFHDAYSATGATLALGLLQRDWADRLTLRGHFASYDRDVQHNGNMSVPYGEVTFGRTSAGTNLSYRKRFGAWRLDLLGNYGLRRTRFRDLSRCRYDWYGRCFVELPLAGEIDSIARDQHVDEHSLLGRAELTYTPLTNHTLRLALSSTWVRRKGHDDALAAGAYDPLRAARRMTSNVLGAEYEITVGKLAATAFLKGYQQNARSEEQLLTALTRSLRSQHRSFGAGDSLRWKLTEQLYAKGSFEYALRLPTADERFGDGGLIADNAQLQPERSQNLNLGLLLEPLDTPLGRLGASTNFSARRVESLILLLNTGGYFQYSNVLRARALGLDARASWSAQNERFGVEGGFGYQDVRNTSTTGPVALFHGDRIPNQPFLQLSGRAYVRAQDALQPGDQVELGYDVRYVREFLLGWESAAAEAVKLKVPSQTVHALSVSHVTAGATTRMSNSFEVQNLTDARVFDFYGVQRPGRAFFWKLGLDYQ